MNTKLAKLAAAHKAKRLSCRLADRRQMQLIRGRAETEIRKMTTTMEDHEFLWEIWKKLAS